jgi:hypothetical protein
VRGPRWDLKDVASRKRRMTATCGSVQRATRVSPPVKQDTTWSHPPSRRLLATSSGRTAKRLSAPSAEAQSGCRACSSGVATWARESRLRANSSCCSSALSDTSAPAASCRRCDKAGPASIRLVGSAHVASGAATVAQVRPVAKRRSVKTQECWPRLWSRRGLWRRPAPPGPSWAWARPLRCVLASRRVVPTPVGASCRGREKAEREASGRGVSSSRACQVHALLSRRHFFLARRSVFSAGAPRSRLSVMAADSKATQPNGTSPTPLVVRWAHDSCLTAVETRGYIGGDFPSAQNSRFHTLAQAPPSPS